MNVFQFKVYSSICLFLISFVSFTQVNSSLDEIEGIIKSSVPYYQQEPTKFLEYMLQADSLLNHAPRTEKFYVLKGKVKNNLGVYHWKTEKLIMGLNYLDSSLFYRKKNGRC